MRKFGEDPSDPFFIPKFCRMTREQRRAAREKSPPPTNWAVLRRDDDARRELTPEEVERSRKREEDKWARVKNSSARKQSFKAERAFKIGKNQRWDARLGCWVDEDLAPRQENIMDTTLNFIEKDFAVMKPSDLVRWYNGHVAEANEHKMASYRPVTKFETRQIAITRCSRLASALRAALGVKEPTDEPVLKTAAPAATETAAPAAKETQEETDEMKKAKKAAAKKSKPAVKRSAAKSEGGKREIGKPAKSVAELKMTRDGTDRAMMIRLAAKPGATLDSLAKALKWTTAYVLVNLYSMNRDVGLGYEVNDGRVILIFPGSKTVKDVIKVKIEK